MPDNTSGMNKLYSSYIYFWTAYRLESGSLGAHLFAYQEVRVTGLLGVVVLCYQERHLTDLTLKMSQSLHPGVKIVGVTLLWNGNFIQGK